MLPLPFTTRSTTSESGGFAWSRFGPTLPWVPASARVWQPAQGPVLKTVLPATGSPFLYSAGTVAVCAFGTVPTTFVGVGVTTFSPGFDLEQAAAAGSTRARSTTRGRRGASAESIGRSSSAQAH